MIRRRLSLVALTLMMIGAPAAFPILQAGAVSPSWTTNHLDPGRTGNDTNDPGLGGPVTPVWTSPALDGRVYGEPMLLNGSLYAATQQNSIYAMNATTGLVSWSLTLSQSPNNLLAVPRSHVDHVASIGSGCGNIDPLGIIGTPVIDPGLGTGGTLFAVAEAWDGTNESSIHHELVAVDLATHLVTKHIGIDPPGVGFDTAVTRALEQERGALALAGGNVVVPFGGLSGDCGGYHGFAVSTAESLSGAVHEFEINAPTAGVNANNRAGGIWAAVGPAVDAAGNVYVTTGNGFEPSSSTYEYTDGVVKLDSNMNLVDYFGPTLWRSDDGSDRDLGSSSPVLIPRQSGNPLVFAVGKQFTGYLLDSGHLSSSSTHIGGELFSAHVCDQEAFGGNAYANGIVYVPCREGLRALTVNTGTTPSFAQAWIGPGDASGPPILAGGRVWVHGSGQMYGLNPTTGAVEVDLAVSTPYNFGSPSAGGDTLFFASGAGVAAFGHAASNQVAANGLDGAVYYKPDLQSWTPLAGTTTAAPAVVSVPTVNNHGDAAFIATGLDGNLNIRDTTSDWEPLTTGGPVGCIDNPAATIGAGVFWVACQGTDRALYAASAPLPGSGLPHVSSSSWHALGGGLSTGPAVAFVGGLPTFFVIGLDGAVYIRTDSTGYSRQDWFCRGHPAAATSGSNTYFACHGRDDALWYMTSTGGGAWSGGNSLGGGLIDGPGISFGPGGPTFFVEGLDAAVYERSISIDWTREGGGVRHGVGAAWVP